MTPAGLLMLILIPLMLAVLNAVLWVKIRSRERRRGSRDGLP